MHPSTTPNSGLIDISTLESGHACPSGKKVSQATSQHRRQSSTYDRNVKLIADFADRSALGPSQSVDWKGIDDEMTVAFGGGGSLLKLDDGSE
jgi:hypothetical protein